MADAECVNWTTIHHLCSQSAAEWYAAKVYGIARNNVRRFVARNVKLYVQQASEFYHAAVGAKSNTAPLFYYYSFLNLAKALCEFTRPGLHERDECYAHGLTWRPDRRTVSNFARDSVTVVRRRGVFHALWESLMRQPWPLNAPAAFPIRSLFSYCPEISSEYRSVFGGCLPLVELDDPNIVKNKARDEVWLRFSVARKELRRHGLHASKFLTQVRINEATYEEVKAGDPDLRMFESTEPRKQRRHHSPWDAFEAEIIG